MSLLDSVAARLSRPDMLQGSVLLFVALGFTLAVSWPTGISLVNEAWFSIAPVRTTVLAFGALGYGALLGARPRRRTDRVTDSGALPQPDFGTPAWHHEAAATLGAIAVLTVVTAPFEVVSHAASYPGTDVVWSLLVPFLTVGGYFGLGLLLGRAAATIRLRALLPLLVPAVLAGGAWLDLSLGVTLVNPWTAALSYSPLFAGVLCILSLVTAWAVFPRRRRVSAESAADGAGA